MSRRLQQALLKSLPILLPALPGPNAWIRDCIQKAVLKSIIPAAFKIDLSRWRRKSRKHFFAIILGKWPKNIKGHSLTICWMNVWIEKCWQNFTLRRSHPQRSGLLPKTVSSYLIHCHLPLVKATDSSKSFSNQSSHSFTNHLLKAFSWSRCMRNWNAGLTTSLNTRLFVVFCSWTWCPCVKLLICILIENSSNNRGRKFLPIMA